MSNQKAQGNRKPKLNIKKGDTVQVISGEDKGKEGRVLTVYPKQHRLLIEGVNVVKRHTKPDAQNPQGGINEKEAPVHVSNVQIVDPKTGEPTRVGRQEKDGKKVRYAKKSGEVID